MKIERSAFILVAALAGCAASPEPVYEELSGSIVQVTSFGSNPAGLRMWKYVPANMPPNAPLVLALHACTQQAADYVKVGWNALADQYKFYVVYPEQNSANNALDCFNWAGSNTNYVTGQNDTANLTRGMGENLSIKQMVDNMKANYSIDDGRVFVTGLSGGAAETALLLAVWPDVFAAGASFAGVPYNCTSNANQVTTCMAGVNKTPQQWGDLVRMGDPGYSGPWPRFQIWQGANDSVVNIDNSSELMKQWTDVHGVSQTPAVTSTIIGGKVAYAAYRDSSGANVVETFKVASMDHGVPIDPNHACGTAAQYILDEGFCSAYWVALDWGIAGTASLGDGGLPSPDGGSIIPGGGGSAGAGGGAGSGGFGGGSGVHSPVTPSCGVGCAATGTRPNGDATPIGLALLALLWSARRRRAHGGDQHTTG